MSDSQNITLHIGFDDTDSLRGSCTTFLALRLVERIAKDVKFLDYPRLIRNNPNIPWKTRGNGAIGLTLKVGEDAIESIVERAINTINEMYEKDKNTNPGVVFFKGEVPQEFKQFAHRTLTEVVSIKTAKDFAEKFCLKHYTIGNGRGLIGGISAIGNTLQPELEDFTYELLTYRMPQNIKKKRVIDYESLILADKKYSPQVFNNIDEESKKGIIAPAGPDPVLYGIRGEKPTILLEMMEEIKTKEPISSYCIFRTNQGTDQHFKYASSDLVNYNVFKGKIKILEKPKTIPGGHVISQGELENDKSGVDIAAFEPSKGFRKIIKNLLPEDRIMAFGGVKYKEEFQGFTIQLEKCEILYLADHFKESSPFCPNCNNRMISDGFKKGHKCRKCGYKDQKLTKVRTLIDRKIEKGLFIPPAQAQRHLVKPHRRYSLPLKKAVNLIDNWWKA
ncbi:MAG: TiaS agmantine-binding domain-containing protein [Candidatus Heimdallarchaeaceae archaeon]